MSSPECSQHRVGSSSFSLAQQALPGAHVLPPAMTLLHCAGKEKPLPKTSAAAMFFCHHERPSLGAQGEVTSGSRPGWDTDLWVQWNFWLFNRFLFLGRNGQPGQQHGLAGLGEDMDGVRTW